MTILNVVNVRGCVRIVEIKILYNIRKLNKVTLDDVILKYRRKEKGGKQPIKKRYSNRYTYFSISLCKSSNNLLIRIGCL